MRLSRSENMRRIRGADTRPEVALRKSLWATGARYRLKQRTPAGRADIAFVSKRVAVFVDGCFWHGCPEHYVRPRSRVDFWADKLRTNVERDSRQTIRAEDEGWVVIRIWEHEIRESLERAADRVRAVLDGDRLTQPSSWRALQVVPVEGDIERWTLIRLRDPATCRNVTRTRTTHKVRRSSSLSRPPH